MRFMNPNHAGQPTPGHRLFAFTSPAGSGCLYAFTKSGRQIPHGEQEEPSMKKLLEAPEIDPNNNCSDRARVPNSVLRELALPMIQALPGLTFMPLHALHVKKPML